MPRCASESEKTESVEDHLSMDQWLKIRREAGLKIDPENAEVCWRYAQTLDPYGIDPDLPEECQQIGREYFARSPESDIWVCFGDLPEGVREKLWKMRMSEARSACRSDHQLRRQVWAK
jgi:hypothetical protein